MWIEWLKAPSAASRKPSLRVGWAWMVPAMSSSRAPISSARPKAADNSAHALPDRLDAEHQMVVGPAQRHGRTLPHPPWSWRGHWPGMGTCPVLISLPRPCASSGERPAVTISGSVKQIAGNAALVPARFCAGDDLGHHLALRHRPMRQHRLAGDVADGIDAAHRGAALVVDADEPAVHVEVELPRGPSPRSPACGRP